MAAEAAYVQLQRTWEERARKDPDAVIEISPKEKTEFLDGRFYRVIDEKLRIFKWTGADSLERHFYDHQVADTFLWNNSVLSSRKFRIETASGEHDTVEGGHLNYVAVGMLNSHYGIFLPLPNLALSVIHNGRQVFGDKQGDGLRNVMDIRPGAKYMDMGSDYYRKKFDELKR
jgi:hypothetical protein